VDTVTLGRQIRDAMPTDTGTKDEFSSFTAFPPLGETRESRGIRIRWHSISRLRQETTACQVGRPSALLRVNKSTLLKILSRITEPTSRLRQGYGGQGGRAVMRGRVGSLLDVGSGFHPELTGVSRKRCNSETLELCNLT
jgi:hypothetical protein